MFERERVCVCVFLFNYVIVFQLSISVIKECKASGYTVYLLVNTLLQITLHLQMIFLCKDLIHLITGRSQTGNPLGFRNARSL